MASTQSTIWIVAAGFFAFLGMGIWLLFGRAEPSEWAVGTITSKTFKPAGTYWQYQPGDRQGFRTANPIPVAESFVFEIDVPKLPGPAHYALNTVASQQFEVGQRVRIELVRRGVAWLWSRVYVLDMRPE